MIYDYFVNSFQIFLAVFVRLIGMFTTAPFFSGMAFPWRMRLGFTFFVSLVTVPLVIAMGIQPPTDIIDYGVRLISNFVFGLGIGFFIFVIISAFQISAQVFSIPMGMGMNEVIDPMSQVQVPAIGNILGVAILFLLLRIDGHFTMIRIIVDSFDAIDLIDLRSFELFEKGMTQGVMIMFDIALKIALPVIAITVLLDIAMGLISRVAPQFNVMIMGFNMKLIAGFLILWLVLPSLVDLGTSMLNGLMESAYDLIQYMRSA